MLKEPVDYFTYAVLGLSPGSPMGSALKFCLVAEGSADFYRGETARLFAGFMKENGGLITLEDLLAEEPASLAHIGQTSAEILKMWQQLANELSARAAVLRAAEALAGLKLVGDEQIGVDIVHRACEEPLRQIVGNAGLEGAIVAEKVRTNDNPNFGLNAQTGEYEDLVQSGVIDPTKVTRTALQNAASVAGLMLTTDAMVAELVEEKKGGAGGGMPDMGGMGGMGGMDM